TTLVKSTLKLMTWIKIKIATVSAAVVLVVATVLFAGRQPSSNVVKDPDNRKVRLERYEFQAAPVRYVYPPSSPRPIEEVSSPAFAGEPLLSAEFSWQVGPSFPLAGGMRVIAADEQGNEFDAVVNYGAGFEVGDGREYWAGDVAVFPRRGKYLNLR